MGKKKSSTAAAVIPIRPGIVIPAHGRTFSAAAIAEFKERYLAVYLPVLRKHLLADPSPKESFEWQTLFCLVNTARAASRGRRAPRGGS